MFTELGLLGVLMLVLAYFFVYQPLPHLPRGPRPLPLIGNFGKFFRTEPYLALHEMAKKFGSIYTFTLGSKPFVVVADMEFLGYLLNNPVWEITDFTPRFLQGGLTDNVLRYSRCQSGALLSKMIKGELTEKLPEWVANLKGLMADGRHAVINSHTIVDIPVIHAVYRTLLYNPQHDISALAQSVLLLSEKRNKVKFLGSLFPKIFPDNEEELEASFNNLLKDRSNRDPPAHLKDLLITTSHKLRSTLAFAVLYLSLNPQVQETMFEEMSQFLHKTQLIFPLEHRKKLPYAEAVLLEVERLSNVVPLTQCYKSTKELDFNGYTIPKGTLMIGNLYTLNMTKELWGRDISGFRPERFLHGGELVNEKYYPSLGTCPYKQVANDMIFLYLTTLVRNFHFSTVPGHMDPSTKPLSGHIRGPSPFNLALSKR